MNKRLRYASAIVLAAAALVVCTSPPVPPPASQGVGLQASFVLANPAGLLALDKGGHAIGRIIDLPAQSAPATPVLHPSGKSIVFALTGQPDRTTGFGSDLYIVNLDGTGYKPVVQHEGDNVSWGEGDTPLRVVLLMLKKEKWPIPAYVEYEYKGTGTPTEEVKKCFQFAKQILA